MVLSTVVRANCFPSTHAPSKNMSTLNTLTKRLMGMPMLWFTKRARPVVPPVMSPFGTMNSTTAAAYIIFPNTISPRLNTILAVVFFFSMILVLSHCTGMNS